MSPHRASRTRRWSAGLALGALMLLAVPSPARAELDGPCEASGTFTEGGMTVDARAIGTETVTIPRKDTVSWQGSVTAANTPRATSGFVAVDLPPPFGRVTIDTWGDPAANSISEEGVEEYDLGIWVPGGVTFRVFGEHRDGGDTCSGEVFVEVDGSPFGSPVTAISLAATILTGTGLLFTIRPLFRRVV